MSFDVTPTTLPPRSGTVREKLTDEVIAQVKAALEQTRGRPRAAVAIGGEQEKEGTARTITEAVMEKLAALEPPIHVRTHIKTVKGDDGKPKGYIGSVSLTPDGKPSRRVKAANGNGETEPAAPAAAPAAATADAGNSNDQAAPAETPAATTGRNRR